MKIGFISAMHYYAWGGSEELWSQAAVRMAQAGSDVRVCCGNLLAGHPRMKPLLDAGIRVRPYSTSPQPFVRRVMRRLTGDRINPGWIQAAGRFMSQGRVNLVVISQGSSLDGLELALEIRARKLPYVLVIQQVAEEFWPDDTTAARLRLAYQGAMRVCCVSQVNLRLLEDQIGAELGNGTVVRNPFAVDYEKPLPWPEGGSPVRFAAVGVLQPVQKAQDLLLHSFANPVWRERNWSLDIFGEGSCRASLERLRNRLGLDRVVFRGHLNDIPAIWRSHHLLLHCTRREGLPIALVEAMLSGRPAVVTDVAGHKELVEDGVEGFVAEAPAIECVFRAIERAWQARQSWEEMGLRAHEKVRRLVPRDPVGHFCKFLESVGAS